MSKETVKGAKRANSTTTFANAVSFLIDQKINERVNTAEIMTVGKSDPQPNTSTGGKLTATPMVQRVDGFGKTVKNAPISNMPFYRPQAGKAAIIMEPQPGDKALAVFSKLDSSNLAVGQNDQVQPGSHRKFDQADGFLINGILGVEPEIWLMLDPASGNIELSTKAASVEISCRDSGDMVIKTGSGAVTIECTTAATITCPKIELEGDVHITGSLTVDGATTGSGGGPAVFSNGILNQANGITDQDVTVKTHLHSGIQPGGANTAVPVPGT